METILEFLRNYEVDQEARSISLSLLRTYIERQNELGELTEWTVSVRGRESADRNLGDIDLAF
jgi:hypothetical protein